MSVEAIALASRLQLRLVVGEENGVPVMRTRTYSNVKTGAEDDAVYEVAQHLAGLQVHDVEIIRRVNEFELVENE